MEQLKNRATALILGLVLAYAALWIIGVGAAIAIPAELLRPLAQVSTVLAFTLVDVLTIAVPLTAAFLILAFVVKLLIKKPDVSCYLLLLAPLVLTQLYFTLQAQPFILDNLLVMLPRYLLLAACLYFLVRGDKAVQA